MKARAKSLVSTNGRTVGPVGRHLRFLAARSRGWRDGRRSIPTSADTAHPAELMKLRQHGEGHLRQFATAWADADAQLKGDYCALAQDHEDAVSSLREPEEDVEVATELWKRRGEELEEARTRERKRSSEARFRISPIAYWLIVGAIVVGELYFNAIVFRLLGESEVATWVMTAFVAFPVVGCAHVIGVFLRKEKRSQADRSLLALAAIVPVIVFPAVGIVRDIYLSDGGAGRGGVASLGPLASTLLLTVLSVPAFVLTLVLSYFSHDPVTREVRRAEQDLRTAEAELQRRRRAARNATARMVKIGKDIERLYARRVGTLKAYTYEALRHKSDYEAQMDAYRAANIRARVRPRRLWHARGEVDGVVAPAKLPAILEAVPAIDIPQPFLTDELDWQCGPSVPLAAVAPIPLAATIVPADGATTLAARALRGRKAAANDGR